MPVVPSVSPATGHPTSSSFVHTLDCNFVDNAGRTLLLRGVNLSGSSKAPVDRPSYLLDDFWEGAQDGGESFIGRPLNVDDGSADIHLARLKGWGFNMLRFPITWEALEHAGPGKYDYEFMDYTIRVLRKCKLYGFKVYLDPHQDTWSRFSGGSGAPFWTLAACGINPRNFTATQAAIVHCEYPLAHDPDPASLPAMIWSTNYGRLASQTVFTLFFAGRDFAPKCIIDGMNIQDYLEKHYVEAMGKFADRIRDAGDLLDECVIGWDSLNEPFEGLCGWPDLSTTPPKQGSTLKKGTYPTPAQSLRLGMGQAQTVDHWTFGTFGPSRNGSVTIDPKGFKMWADPETEPNGMHPKWGWKRDQQWSLGICLWAQHGVWDIESGYILRPDYFRYLPGAEENMPVEFILDYWLPHWQIYRNRIRQAHPEAILFISPPVFAPPPKITEDELKGRCCYSPHYYDGLTLITRHWNWFNADALGLLRGKYSTTLEAVKIGETAIRKSLQEQLGMFKDDATILGSYPTILGEIGTPFDMDGKRSYGWTDKGKHKGDYSRQERALDASLNGADGGNMMNWTVWTYCPDGGHDWGDGWNMEDLSLWCADDLAQRKLENEEGQSMYTMGDASRAQLLRKNISRPSIKGEAVGTAATSTLSLATLGMGAGAVFEEMRSHKSADSLSGWHENPYDFLTDGARAVRAFCRPSPCKVIGRTKNLKFDIRKAELKMSVIVRPEDRLRETSGDKEESLATEIYVPLVHFGQERLVGGRQRSMDQNSNGGDDGNMDPSAKNRFASRSASTFNLSSPTCPPPPSVSSGSSTAVNGSPVRPEVAPRRIELDVLDVEVRVSAGRWVVEGQVLKWWYAVPAEGEIEREYTIEVRRRGGAIAVQAHKPWIRKVCPTPGCCIM